MYTFATNSSDFLGSDEGQVLCRPIKAKRLWRGTLRYWRVSYEFWFDPPEALGGTWNARLLDQGLCKINAAGNPEPIKRKGNPITQPVLLDGSGSEFAPATLALIRAGVGEPVYREFLTRREADFDDLNIPEID